MSAEKEKGRGWKMKSLEDELRGYCKQLEPWPEPPKAGNLSDPGLRPEEKRKILGTYKNHKKKREITMVMYSQKNQWARRAARRKVNSGFPVENHFRNGWPTSELIKLKGNSKSLDPVKCKDGYENRRMDDSEEEMKLPTNEHRGAIATSGAESTTPPVLAGIDINQAQTSKDHPASELIRHLPGVVKSQGSVLVFNFFLMIHLKGIMGDKPVVCAVGEIPLRIFRLIR